jgi:hypothetical protein
MLTLKGSKKTSAKSSKKGTQKRPLEEAGAAARMGLDQQPRSEEGAKAARSTAAEAALKERAFASTVNDLNRHPRPIFQVATVPPPLARAAGRPPRMKLHGRNHRQ